MTIAPILEDKKLKSKEKTEALSRLILEEKISPDEFIAQVKQAKDSHTGSCIEALEFASKARPEIITASCLAFVTQQLGHKAPRVRWESAKVIGNVAHLHPASLDEAISRLLVNSEDPGTVVRWSAAYALGEIIQYSVPHRGELIETVKAISERDEKNSIRKIYQAALKKVQH
ncbi:MAG: HEAT repeat domain-containing protein [Bacteroidota bacterium]